MTTAKGWSDFTMSELFSIKHGFGFDGKYFASEGDYILLTPGNFKDEGGFKLKTKEKFFTGDFDEQYLLPKCSLIVAMTEQAEGLLGSSALIPEAGKFLHNQRLGLIAEERKDRIDIGFLYYLFNSRNVRAQIRGAATGTKVRHTSPTRIGAVKVTIPNVPTQRKIASILSAYDDLIENNTRRIAILEEMAQAIYREWFVNFRFPGHENVKLVDSPLGQIPEGWEAGTTADYVTNGELELQTGPFGTQLKASDYTESGTPVINVRNIGYGSIRPDKLEHVPLAICERLAQHLLETGDIVFGRKGAVDRHVLITKAEHGWMQGSDCIRMRSMSERALPQLLTFAFRDESHHDWMLSQCSHGATMASLNQDVIKRIPILLPSSDLLDRFFEISSDVLRAVSVLQRRNSNLRTTRDLLLPKLISGQLDVEDLEIDVGMTAEELTEAAAG